MLNKSSSDARLFCNQAAAMRCQAGSTGLVGLMEQARVRAGVSVLHYIGDCFEVARATIFEQADAYQRRSGRAIHLHGASTCAQKARTVVEEIARRTDADALISPELARPDDLGDILEAVAVHAYGEVKRLDHKKGQLPGAPPAPFCRVSYEKAATGIGVISCL